MKGIKSKNYTREQKRYIRQVQKMREYEKKYLAMKKSAEKSKTYLKKHKQTVPKVEKKTEEQLYKASIHIKVDYSASRGRKGDRPWMGDFELTKIGTKEECEVFIKEIETNPERFRQETNDAMTQNATFSSTYLDLKWDDAYSNAKLEIGTAQIEKVDDKEKKPVQASLKNFGRTSL